MPRQRTSSTFRRLTRIPYRRNYRQRSARTILSQGGVPGGATRISPKVPVAAEVKFKDTVVGYSSLGGAWNLVQANMLQGITQGTGASQRIGRSIKIVGITYRVEVAQTGAQVYPYSMDFGFDKQSNSALPVVTDIYSGTSPVQLPNPIFDRRYKFLKRMETKDAQQLATLMTGVIKVNQVVNFSGTLGTIADMEDFNLFMTFASTVTTSLQGIIRVNYVDA